MTKSQKRLMLCTKITVFPHTSLQPWTKPIDNFLHGIIALLVMNNAFGTLKL